MRLWVGCGHGGGLEGLCACVVLWDSDVRAASLISSHIVNC